MSQLKDVNVKYTPDEFEGMTETAIAGNKVAIIVYSDIPIGFYMEDEAVAKSYKHFFTQLWTTARS